MRKYIATKIMNARRERGLTQPELGKLIGKSRNTIIRYEQLDDCDIKMETLEKIAEAVGKPVSYFLPASAPDENQIAEQRASYSAHRKGSWGWHSEQGHVPVTASISAARIQYIDKQPEKNQEWVVVPDDLIPFDETLNYAAMAVHGDCLEPVIPDRARVIIRLLKDGEQPDHGSIVAVDLGDHTKTLKEIKYKKDDAGRKFISLEPVNPKYAGKDIPLYDDIHKYKLIGQAVIINERKFNDAGRVIEMRFKVL